MNIINPSHRQFLRLPLKGKLAFVRYLASANGNRTGTTHKEGAWQQLKRSHHQLPCSLDTRERRARLFLEMGFQHKNVCLLGDDDLVSLELIRLGFTHVTVYDCDPIILQRIAEKIPTEARASIELKQVDFTEPDELRQGFADLVCLDPPYNREGLDLFLRTALLCSKPDQGSQLILMTIPQLFRNQQNDWSAMKMLLSRNGYHLDKRLQGFNSYPLHPISRIALFFASCVVAPAPRSLKSIASYEFFSDCLIWQRRTISSSLNPHSRAF